MQMHARGCRELRLPHRPHAERRDARAIALEVVGLKQQHVAAVAAPVERTACGRAVLHRRDQLDELVAEHVDRVVDAEHRDVGIAERRIEAEQRGQPASGPRQVADAKTIWRMRSMSRRSLQRPPNCGARLALNAATPSR
jgi:hypothetical protein